RFSGGSPGPTGLNTRSATASRAPSVALSSTSRVLASRVTPYTLSGAAGASSRTGTPGVTAPYSAAEPSTTSRAAGAATRMASTSRAVTRTLASTRATGPPDRRPAQLTTTSGQIGRAH